MPDRRILSIWFPRLAAERVLRLEPGLADQPFAIVAEAANSQILASLSARAEAEGLHRGMALADARALCPDLLSRPAAPLREAAFLATLRRWAGRFSPWAAEEGAESLVLDITGCAHLFGGEAGLVEEIADGCHRLGLSQRIGLADTLGAAWALARFAGSPAMSARSGDAIDQEAPATRSRAFRRKRWERGGHAPSAPPPSAPVPRIVPPGHARAALGPLPVSALRLPPDTVAGLVRLGLRRIEDLAVMPRAALARRFGLELVRRLDQAMGAEPEPVSPARPEERFAVRLTLPDPIGLEDDLLAGLDRLLPPLCAKLRRAGCGARRVRFGLHRVDRSVEMLEVGLARPSFEPDRIRPLLALKTGGVDAGFGFDMLRLEAHVTEPLTATQHKGHLAAAEEARARHAPGGGAEMDALVNRLGARLGMEALTRLHPADSHIPEKSATAMVAAYAAPPPRWPAPPGPRPLRIFPPEMISPADSQRPPQGFRWRRQDHRCTLAVGPERIAPEWWLDDPAWRSGPRDYWRIETETGERLWLFEARGAEVEGGWFVQGAFG
ncbi:Y-family DNA polymerase [Oceanomicrobium pacificus]|uniref:DNA polymerase Y family protein n=1 Tax=Oceanomicrobium pacificus TaxID=2692916 RepID=A0A6B0TUU1_9RHOB|nr:DNA polymerase Y family protein [Oceanomicrobium pacificus]MXU64914.1 DNA polymerase Y family protein [Oceanomicrobium pacificus]